MNATAPTMERTAAPRGAATPTKQQPTGRLHRVMVSAIALVGVLVLLFPTISNWFSSLDFKDQRINYEKAVDEIDPETRAQLFSAARDYNAHLPGGPLRDPYMLDGSGKTIDLRDDNENYFNQLSIGDGGSMGWIEIPRINVSLPINHGTDAKTLDKGAGHLHGSALPVGGSSTHSVVTAHSGRATSKLFTDLDKLKKGDVFFSEVLGERFYYRVDNIDVVEPVYSGDKLRQVVGKDYMTLLTCTPTGVNSHRLLVRGERIDGPEAESALKEIRAADYIADFPWWIPVVVGVPIAVWLLLAAADKRSRRQKTSQHERRGIAE
ncbi:class C sortase [Leucobacter viscericola]|uniref:Class C sortase n=1 Tax=Leucobacter viscericola TaxID=2714935 RepID=A0A6G7XG81_9MICO|nr:class C sortase [Leucobacter viscericola]QIK63449.1 class C sortase [Leucobacter viscericola]